MVAEPSASASARQTPTKAPRCSKRRYPFLSLSRCFCAPQSSQRSKDGATSVECTSRSSAQGAREPEPQPYCPAIIDGDGRGPAAAERMHHAQQFQQRCGRATARKQPAWRSHRRRRCCRAFGRAGQLGSISPPPPWLTAALAPRPWLHEFRSCIRAATQQGRRLSSTLLSGPVMSLTSAGPRGAVSLWRPAKVPCSFAGMTVRSRALSTHLLGVGPVIASETPGLAMVFSFGWCEKR
jgi:hypothetical protein